MMPLFAPPSACALRRAGLNPLALAGLLACPWLAVAVHAQPHAQNSSPTEACFATLLGEGTPARDQTAMKGLLAACLTLPRSDVAAHKAPDAVTGSTPDPCLLDRAPLRPPSQASSGLDAQCSGRPAPLVARDVSDSAGRISPCVVALQGRQSTRAQFETCMRQATSPSIPLEQPAPRKGALQ
jgi:hypothetical protein